MDRGEAAERERGGLCSEGRRVVGRSRETLRSYGADDDGHHRQSFDAVDDINREELVLIREGFNSATLLQPAKDIARKNSS